MFFTIVNAIDNIIDLSIKLYQILTSDKAKRIYEGCAIAILATCYLIFWAGRSLLRFAVAQYRGWQYRRELGRAIAMPLLMPSIESKPSVRKSYHGNFPRIDKARRLHSNELFDQGNLTSV